MYSGVNVERDAAGVPGAGGGRRGIRTSAATIPVLGGRDPGRRVHA